MTTCKKGFCLEIAGTDWEDVQGYLEIVSSGEECRLTWESALKKGNSNRDVRENYPITGNLWEEEDPDPETSPRTYLLAPMTETETPKGYDLFLRLPNGDRRKLLERIRPTGCPNMQGTEESSFADHILVPFRPLTCVPVLGYASEAFYAPIKGNAERGCSWDPVSMSLKTHPTSREPLSFTPHAIYTYEKIERPRCLRKGYLYIFRKNGKGKVSTWREIRILGDGRMQEIHLFDEGSTPSFGSADPARQKKRPGEVSGAESAHSRQQPYFQENEKMAGKFWQGVWILEDGQLMEVDAFMKTRKKNENPIREENSFDGGSHSFFEFGKPAPQKKIPGEASGAEFEYIWIPVRLDREDVAGSFYIAYSEFRWPASYVEWLQFFWKEAGSKRFQCLDELLEMYTRMDEAGRARRFSLCKPYFQSMREEKNTLLNDALGNHTSLVRGGFRDWGFGGCGPVTDWSRNYPHDASLLNALLDQDLFEQQLGGFAAHHEKEMGLGRAAFMIHDP